MTTSLLIKAAFIVFGVYLLFGAIWRRRQGRTSGRMDPAVDRLLVLLGCAAAVLIGGDMLGYAVRARQWPGWIVDILDVTMPVAALSAFVCAAMVGWRLIGEKQRNRQTQVPEVR